MFSKKKKLVSRKSVVIKLFVVAVTLCRIFDRVILGGITSVSDSSCTKYYVIPVYSEVKAKYTMYLCQFLLKMFSYSRLSSIYGWPRNLPINIDFSSPITYYIHSVTPQKNRRTWVDLLFYNFYLYKYTKNEYTNFYLSISYSPKIISENFSARFFLIFNTIYCQTKICVICYTLLQQTLRKPDH